MRPLSVKELSIQARDYSYSENIKLKLWISSLNYLLTNSNNYLRQRYYAESYKMKVRFCEIMLNKLSTHPDVKLFKRSTVLSERQVYDDYMMLYKKIPMVLEEIDKLKEIIDSNYNEYIRLKQESDQLQKLQEEKYLQQRRLYANNTPSPVLVPKIDNNDDDDSFFSNLDKPQLGKVDDNTIEIPSYPQLPQIRSNSIDTFQYDFPSTSEPPQLPLKQDIQDVIEHKTVNFTEGGSPLRTIFVSSDLQKEFLKISQKNTTKKLETCGILAGKLSRNAFFITHLLIPEQISTANSCETLDEEELFLTVDKLELFILGWIHTHPTQSCFLSSVDLHTQNSYQIMLNELIAIVLSPDEKFINRDFGCFRLTDPPGLPTISRCNRTGFHPHEELNLYVTCNRVNNDTKMGHVVIKSHLPFEVVDLRKKKQKHKK